MLNQGYIYLTMVEVGNRRFFLFKKILHIVIQFFPLFEDKYPGVALIQEMHFSFSKLYILTFFFKKLFKVFHVFIYYTTASLLMSYY